MSKKTKLSQAELCTLAYEGSDRVLVVHCGYCLDESGKVDRQHPLGWLGYSRPRSRPVGGWSFFDIATGKPGQEVIKCPRCGKWLEVKQRELNMLYLQINVNDNRTTLKTIAEVVLALSTDLAFEDLAGLKLLDDKASVMRVLDSYQNEAETVEEMAKMERELAETKMKLLAELTDNDEYFNTWLAKQTRDE